MENLRLAIQRTISEWVDVSRIHRVDVWLSGGVDSSTLLFSTCEALGSEKVRAYSVDFGGQNEVERAKLVADWCDVRLLMEEMTAKDSIQLTEEAILNQRGPVDTTHVIFASKLCSQDEAREVLSALGLDELQGGYPAHVNAGDEEFFEAEANLLWKCQSSYAWVQRIQSRQYVEVKFPFLRRELIAWCRVLPRTHKCMGRETKVRLREELGAESLIPKKIIEAGKIAGTKAGFCPIPERWFQDGLEEWCEENLPLNCLTYRTRSRIDDVKKGYLRRKWPAASINIFLSLLDEGKLNYIGSDSCKDHKHDRSTRRTNAYILWCQLQTCVG